jgi:hypothetical protein
VEAHGGYLCRLDSLSPGQLISLAREALASDQASAEGCSIQVSALLPKRVVRLAFDAPHTYGRQGAHWYQTHHALARLLSLHRQVNVHAYVLDPDCFEEVATYGSGRRVGGDRVDYDELELCDEEAAFDDQAFVRARERWPLGHLAQILGVSRDSLEMLPRARSYLLNLDGTGPELAMSDLLDAQLP